MTKRDALTQVRLAAMSLYESQPGRRGSGIPQLRQANAVLVRAQLVAADVGASSYEINQASEWNGLSL